MKDLGNETLLALRTAVECRLSMRLITPRDFKRASDAVTTAVESPLSSTTLMRLWGYLREPVTPSRSTLNILARFLGYDDFEQWRLTSGDSDMATSRKLDLDALAVGDRVRLQWVPDRVVEAVYEGQRHFRLTRAEQTHLREGDEFDCGLIVDGEPLFLDNLDQHDGRPKGVYVCGRHHGVRFEIIND